MTSSPASSAPALVLVLAMLTSCIVSTFATGTCNDATITNLKLVTNNIVYGINTPVTLNDIQVITQGDQGQYIPTGVESVQVVAPTGMTITGTLTGTTVNGKLTFSGLTVTAIARGTYYLGFMVCGGVRTDQLQLIFRNDNAVAVKFVTQPQAYVTSYGYMPVRPALAFVDSTGNITDIPSLSTWVLAVNDTSVNITGYSVSPTLTSGQVVSFKNFSIHVTPSDIGKVLQLYLVNIGSTTKANATYAFPTPINITVARCNNDFTIGPGDDRASIDYFNVLYGAGSIPLRGWAFLPQLQSTISCRYGGLVYQMVIDDICNVHCKIPPQLAPNRGLPFEFSTNGVVYDYIANVTIINTTVLKIFEVSGGNSNLYVFRAATINVTAHFTVVDPLGNFVYKYFNETPTITCNTTSYYARLDRILTNYYNPLARVNVTPVIAPSFASGTAYMDFAFANNIVADIHPYCCYATGLVSGCVNINVLETCPSPPFIINVTSPRCTTQWDLSLTNCSTQGLTNVTVIGGNFGRGEVGIRIGPYICDQTIHDPVEPARILYGVGCKGYGLNQTVYVFRPVEKIWGKWGQTYSFAEIPEIYSISGCPANYYPSTALCAIDGSDKVTVRGKNFGNFGARVYFYYYVPPGAIVRLEPAASNTTHFNDTTINVTGIIGRGSRFAVAVTSQWNETTIQQYVTLNFAYSSLINCPLALNGRMCNSKGNCNYDTGFCDCFNTDVLGRWTLSNCTQCQPNYFGASCIGYCPVDRDGYVCGNRGTCSSGVNGDGTCTCNAGYGGLACNITCPGGAASPCGGKGVCVQNVTAPYCRCFSNATAGFYGGTTCSSCQNLYVGPSCSLQCPSYYLNVGIACMGLGTCLPVASAAVCSCPTGYCGASCEYSGTDCGVCPAGLYGASCTGQCPGYPSSVCSGHGTCLNGTRGSGACICQGGYSGVSCSLYCPGSNATTQCSGHGQCDSTTGTCACDSYWTTSNCSTSCPGLGTTAGVCSGNGRCDVNTGSCVCITGYTGAMCQTVCNGGVSSPCSFHGQCLLNGTCACSSNATAGYFTGDSCALCQTNWFGPSCNQQCVLVNGRQCNGKGTCTATVDCKCYNDVILGFWAEPNCSNCKPNYYGSTCSLACPGGACNACSGNGNCFDGLTGNGTCACFGNTTNGYWTGAKCSDCQSTYYGTNCSLRCPVSSGGIECTGHGVCSSGIRGSGLCTCNASSTTGFWGGASCNTCKSGYYGANCTQVCPGINTTSKSCSGFGSCSDGFNGTGVCTCNSGYGTFDCSVGCPVSNFQPCGGHGLCLDGASRSGTCQCFSSSNYGFWQNSGCTTCQAGYYGISCILACPRGYNLTCSGNGICSEGTTGSGKCSCNAGFSGANCARACDGGSISPCSGHGTCSQDTGKCACFNSSVFGYWGGRNCSTCDVLYNSGDCTVQCPISSVDLTRPCSGRGTCFEGLCACPTGYCGDACELSESLGQCGDQCLLGQYGATCSSDCPGMNAARSYVCSANGVCSQGKTGTGLCRCFNGYWGANCSGTCPGGATTPCSNLGQCSESTGTCQCFVGYALSDCSGKCPGGPSNVCYNNGVCNSQALCECLSGYVGTDCSQQCPGGFANPCTGHGTCSVTTGLCTCSSTATSGFWSGANCSSCASGYYGSTCTLTCVNGVTVGTTCVCTYPWSGASCNQPCPGTSGSTVCNGHGTCVWGQQYTTGSCTCDTNYYTSTCNVFCSAALCAGQPYFLVNGQCNVNTGVCECISNNVLGFWADTSTRCKTCAQFYWGPTCLNDCPCLQRGTCDQDTGACSCFDDDTRGHFAGSNCQTCDTGYIGSTCTSVDVSITRQRPCSTIIPIVATSGFSYVDSANGLILSGGRPLILCNLSTKIFIAAYDLNATIQTGGVISSSLYFVTINAIDGLADPTTTQYLTFARSSAPTFVPLFRGTLQTSISSQMTGQYDAPMLLNSGIAFARRGMATLGAAIYTSPQSVESISMGDGSILNILSTGIVQLFSATSFSEYDFRAYFTQVLGADITSSILIDPTVLILSGLYNGQMRLLYSAMPLTSPPVVSIFTDQVISGTTLCTTNGCAAGAKLKTDGTYVYFVVLTNDGAGILRFRFTQIDIGVIPSVDSALVMSDYTNVTVNVTAMLLDTVGGAGYAAMNLYSPATGMQPSTIYRFSLVTLSVYGSVSFQKVVDAYEIVTSLSADFTTRTLYATVPLNQQVSIVPLNLFAVTALYPTIADTYGGTIVTVTGEGFANVTVLNCDFNGTYVVGLYVSSQEIHCTAPTGGDERCEGVPLEVSISESQFTNNGLLLRRVSSARISDVYNQAYAAFPPDNAYGSIVGGAWVVLTGFGFQNTLFLACRFSSQNQVVYSYYADSDYTRSGGTQGTKFGDVVFVNSTMVLCHQPATSVPTLGTSSLELTLDGTVYSRSGNAYEMVGAPVGFQAFRESSAGVYSFNFTDSYTSGEYINITDFDIWVVDSSNQRLRKLDATTRNVSIELGVFTFQTLTVGSGNTPFNFSSYCTYAQTVRQPPSYISAGSMYNTTVEGRTGFRGGSFVRPPTGTYNILFKELSAGWQYNFTFTVTVGVAYRLLICQEPSSTTNNLQPTLKQQPVVYAEDISGNQLNSAALTGLRVTATYTVESTSTTAVNTADQNTKTLVGVPITVDHKVSTEFRLAQLQGNFMQFDGIEITGLYGKTYNITFSSPGLPNITSRPIGIDWCNNNTARALTDSSVLMYFAKWNTSECFVCPNGGLCDGTTTVRTLGNNYWRADELSYVFYTCEWPYAGDSCLAPNGTCEVGYEGPRCSSCAPGYGSDGHYCKECPSSGMIVGYTILLLFIILGFVFATLASVFTTYAVDALPSAIKLALNHFQVSSRIDQVQVFPSALSKIFTAQWDISELIRFDAIPAQCSPLNLTIYDQFYFTVALPFVAILFFSFALIGLELYRRHYHIAIKRIPVMFTEQSKSVRRERVMLVVARFMASIRREATNNRTKLRRDDDRDQFYTPLEYLMGLTFVVLMLIYPSIITWSLTMWKCEPLIAGDGTTLRTINVLIADRRIDCDAHSHIIVQRWSLAAAFVYGVLVPFIAYFVVKAWWANFGLLHTTRLFKYYLTGYAREMWWWETTVLARKLLVVFIVMMVSDPILRTYLMMWVMAIALGIHGWFQPFDPLRPVLYYLEGLGITTIVISLNLSLLFQFTTFADGTVGNDALVIILLALNIIVTIVFLAYLVLHVYLRLRRAITGQEEELMTDEAYAELRLRQAAGEDGKEGTDRKAVQNDGVLGLLRKASTVRGAMGNEPAPDNKVVIDPSTVPVSQGETPFERLKRLEGEKRKQFLRKDQAKTQANLEEELEELKERLARAEALAAAEEAVIKRNPAMAQRRQEHEAELNRLMQLIRKERGDVKRLAEDAEGLGNVQFEDHDEDEEEDAFDVDDDY